MQTEQAPKKLLHRPLGRMDRHLAGGRWLRVSGLGLCLLSLVGCHSPDSRTHSRLKASLSLYASFDHGVDADFARGDKRLYHGRNMEQRFAGQPGLPEGIKTRLEPNAGRFGQALHFAEAQAPVVYYRAPQNVDFRSNLWSGTVSVWLSTDPQARLNPGYCDPIQITSKGWDDAAFFFEFEKRTNSIPFRLGVYADRNVWNPNNRDWGKMAANEKPLITVDSPPFSAGKWTHAVFTFENFNTGKPDGVARLYLDGELRGTIDARTQTFHWDPEKSLIMLGIGYVGLYDELSLFDRALSADEIKRLRDLPQGVRSLLP